MKKYYLLALLSLFMLLSGCSSKQQTKVIYKIDKLTAYSSDEMLDTLDDYKDGLVIYIVLKAEYVSDDYKSKIEPGMTAEEIDALILEMRAVSKQYFINLNENFIEALNLNKYGVVEYAKYSGNITIYLGNDELTKTEINELIDMSKSDQVEFVEIRRFK